MVPQLFIESHGGWCGGFIGAVASTSGIVASNIINSPKRINPNPNRRQDIFGMVIIFHHIHDNLNRFLVFLIKK